MLLRGLLLVTLLVAACSEQPGPAPPRPDRWTVELGTAPTLLALTDDDVFAASYGNGVGGSQAYRVDRGTGRKAAQRTLAGQPHGLALGPSGELWLATLQLPDQPSGTGLQVLDPETLQTRRALQVRGIPLSVAFVGEQLWTGDERGLRQLDPGTGAVLREVATEVPAYRLLVVGGALLVVGPTGLQRVDIATARATSPRLLDAGGGVVATARGAHVWVVHPDDQDRSVLQHYEAATLQSSPPAPSPGRAGAAAYLADDALWISDPAGGRLLCADPATGSGRDERPVVLTGPLVADGASVVVAQSGGLTALPADCGAAD